MTTHNTGQDEKLALDGGIPVREKPFHDWPIHDERDEEAVLRVLRSGKWSWGGEETQRFEEEFARSQGANFAVTVTSGSAALEVALAALGVGLGDEVIVPPYTFFATASACLMRGAIPVFADIEYSSFNIDPRDVERKITSRTKAVIPVHIAGCPADMDGVLAVARKHNLVVIEDAAQAHGAQYRGRPVGAIADVGAFSFQSSKNLNSGEGGAVTTDDEDLAARLWGFKNYGRNRRNMVWHEHETLGTNFRMTEFQSAVLRSQLLRLEEQTQRRTQNAQHLARGLEEIGGLTPQRMPQEATRHAYHLFVARYDADAFNGRSRDWFCEALAAEGIPIFGGYQPLYRSAGIRQATQDLTSKLGREFSEDTVGWTNCPVVEEACRSTVWFFNQSALLGTQDDMDDVLRAVAKVRHAANR